MKQYWNEVMKPTMWCWLPAIAWAVVCIGMITYHSNMPQDGAAYDTIFGETRAIFHHYFAARKWSFLGLLAVVWLFIGASRLCVPSPNSDHKNI